MDYAGLEKHVLEMLEGGLPDTVRFHDVAHTREVVAYVREIAAVRGDVSEYELLLLETAALLHDVGYMKCRVDHEQVSEEVARELLPSYGYGGAEIEQIAGLIRATHFPQRPVNKLEEILCDADLYYLFCPGLELKAERLREEFALTGMEFTDAGWFEFEYEFIMNHQFHSPCCRERFERERRHILSQLQGGV